MTYLYILKDYFLTRVTSDWKDIPGRREECTQEIYGQVNAERTKDNTPCFTGQRHQHLERLRVHPNEEHDVTHKKLHVCPPCSMRYFNSSYIL